MPFLNKPSFLFVSHKYPPATGGMEKQSYELIEHMKLLAVVHMIVFDGSESIISFFRKLNKRILDQLRDYPEIEMIHFNDGLIATLSLYHKGYEHIAKTVTVHGLDVVFPLRYFQKKILPRFNRFDKIIAVSSATAEAIRARGIEPERVTVVPNGIDHDWAKETDQYDMTDLARRHPFPKGKEYLVLLGRPVKRKGFSWFLKEVMPKLDPKYHLLIVGPYEENRSAKEWILSLLPKKINHLLALFLGHPSDQDTLRRLLHQPKYANCATHLGKLSHGELQSLLGHAKAFLMPNISVFGDMEGFGLVCLEASSRGALIFASALEGINDAIQHEKNGFLLPSENSEGWIETLNNLNFSKEEENQWRKSFQDYTLQNFSWRKMAASYFSIFQSLNKQKAPDC
ncbi:glycosyltransferase family 4 protein [Sphingobacterium corticis]|uniref:Glycosyltransferase family 4 protein n=1 Tax=Sphingobacterium corticis TaxID=1812823 RepID=A0ABW5NG18_9SPHI